MNKSSKKTILIVIVSIIIIFSCIFSITTYTMENNNTECTTCSTEENTEPGDLVGIKLDRTTLRRIKKEVDQSSKYTFEVDENQADKALYTATGLEEPNTVPSAKVDTVEEYSATTLP